MRTVTPEAIASTLKDDFNIEMDIYTVVRHCAKVLELMGMAELRKEVAIGLVTNQCLKLPPQVVTIASVISRPQPLDKTWKFEIQDITHPPQIVFRSDETDSNGDKTEVPEILANYIPPQHTNFIDYVWECPYLKFNDTDMEVVVEYSIVSLDERGYPKIPEDVTDACVHYAVFKHMQPLFLMQKVSPVVWQEVTRWKNQKINQGKNTLGMKGLTRNGMNNLLNILSSFDRKRVNIDA